MSLEGIGGEQLSIEKNHLAGERRCGLFKLLTVGKRVSELSSTVHVAYVYAERSWPLKLVLDG